MEKEFNQREYIREYNKKNYKQFKAQLKISEKDELDKLLKIHNLSNADFVRQAKVLLEKNEKLFKIY